MNSDKHDLASTESGGMDTNTPITDAATRTGCVTRADGWHTSPEEEWTRADVARKLEVEVMRLRKLHALGWRLNACPVCGTVLAIGKEKTSGGDQPARPAAAEQDCKPDESGK